MFKNIFKNKKGSALPLVIIIAVLVSAAVAVMVNRMRMQAKLKKGIESATEFDVVFTRINSTLSSPAGCNATFYNGSGAYFTVPTDLLGTYEPLEDAKIPIPAARYTDLTYIKKCSAGNTCRPGTATNNTSYDLRNYTTDWDTANTYSGSNSIRAYKIRFYKKQVQTGAMATPTILTVHIGLEKRMIDTNNVAKVVRKDKLIDVYVTLDSTLTRVAACTSGGQSIQAYGQGYDWVLGAWSTPCSGGSAAWNYGAWTTCCCGTASYTYGAWGACSVTTCGGGTQSRTATCNWNANSGYQTRSADCVFTANSGTQSRSVQCYDAYTSTVVADSYCLLPKPATTQSCTPADPALCGTATTQQACTPGGVPSCGTSVTSQSCNTGSCGFNCYCNGNQPAIWKATNVSGTSCLSQSTCGYCGINPAGPYWLSCSTIAPY